MELHYWTKDVEKMIRFYVNILGFKLEYCQPDEDNAIFCILNHANSKIMFAIPRDRDIPNRKDGGLLRLMKNRIGKPGALSAYFEVEGIESFYSQVIKQQVGIVEPLWKTPWNLHQFSLIDPDENVLTFYTPLK